MAGGKLQFEGALAPLIPGTSATISVSGVDPDTYRSAKLELHLLESKPRARDIGGSGAQVVATAPVSLDAISAKLRIPSSLIPAYSGRTIAWNYELCLVGDKLGKDHRVSRPIAVAPSPRQKQRRGRAARSSRPLTASYLVREPGVGRVRELLLAVIFAGIAICTGYAYFVTELEDPLNAAGLWLIIAGLSAVSLHSLWKVMLSPARRLHRMSFKVNQLRVNRGDPIEVEVDTGGLEDLEIGVLYTELLMMLTDADSSSKASDSTVLERFQPAVDGTIMLQTNPRDPPTYPGKQVALHCLVELRSTKTKHGSGRVNVTVDP